MCKVNLFLSSIFYLYLFTYAHAQATDLFLEGKAAYYYPTNSKRFRDIYSDAGLYSLESGVQAWKGLFPWASVGLLYTSGSSLGSSEKTRFYAIPIGLGIKYFFTSWLEKKDAVSETGT